MIKFEQKVLNLFMTLLICYFVLKFYHCRIAVAEYTIDGVPEMNMRPSWMKNPSVGANKIIDDCHDREYT